VEVEHAAPVVASSEAEIAASPEAAWEVITDFASWPEWNPDVRFVEIDGSAEPGTQFRWKAGPTITSTLEEVDRPHRLAWTGKTFGVKAVHVWSFERRGDKTLARTAESWTGFLPRLIPGPMRKTLQKSLDEGLPRLAAEAERRAARAKP
jgi:hypothetical protein